MGSSYANALLHSARQCRRLLVLGAREANEIHIFLRVIEDFRASVGCPARADREDDVFAHREPWHQRMTLEHDTPFQTRAHHLAAVHDD